MALVALVQPPASSCSLRSWLGPAVKAGELIQTMFCQRHYMVHPLWDLSWLSIVEKSVFPPACGSGTRGRQRRHSSQGASGSCTGSLVPVRAEAEHFQAKCANAATTWSWANTTSPRHPAWWGQIKLLVGRLSFNACIAFLGFLENKPLAADINAWLVALRGHPQPLGMAQQWFELC